MSLRPLVFRAATFTTLVALICIPAGLLLPIVLQHALDAGIRTAILWQPDSPPSVDARYRGSPSFNNGAQDYLRVWLFNITNVDAIRAGHKPVLEQVGPFTYRKFKLKIQTLWDNTGKISFKEYDYHIPVPELTGANLSSPIVTLNLPLIGVVESIHASFSPAYQRWWLDLLLKVIAGWRDGHVNGLFITRPAGDIIWGYEDILLQRLSSLLPRGMIQTTTVQLLHNMTGPEEAAAQEPQVFETGVSDLQHIWNVVSDQGHTEVTCWNNCTERVRGSDGTQFHPGVLRSETLPVWVPLLYRMLPMVYREDAEWLGVRFLRFWPDPAASDPDECHFQEIRGLMNLTTPKAVGYNGTAGSSTGPPIYVSPAHFCLCDESLAAAVEGMSCNESLHTTFVDIEPISGVPMRGAIRTMVSSEITTDARMHLEPELAKNNNRSTVMPIFWMEETVSGTDEDVKGFKDKVYGVLWVKEIISRWVPLVGFALLTLSVLMLLSLGAPREAVTLVDEEVDAEAGWQGEEEAPRQPDCAKGAGVSEPTLTVTEPLLQNEHPSG